MTHKEIAKELVEKFQNIDMFDENGYMFWLDKRNAMRAALICVDEMIKESDKYENCEYCSEINWQEVKQEIEKL